MFYKSIATDWSTYSTADLLQLYSDTLEELRRREVLRSANNPSGDYGELLFSSAFGWQSQDNSSAGHDATDGNGTRYQIKCRRLTSRNPSRQLSFIRNLPARPFDVLAGVLLDQDFKVLRPLVLRRKIARHLGIKPKWAADLHRQQSQLIKPGRRIACRLPPRSLCPEFRRVHAVTVAGSPPLTLVP